MRNARIQSAMEYLMTYSWAILIIAVALGALFGLGFFNSASLAPKVGPGSCQIYRPGGSGSTSFINIEGTCNNELPQYVAQFNGKSSQINGSGVSLTSSISNFEWIYPANFGSSNFQTIAELAAPSPAASPYYQLAIQTTGQLVISRSNSGGTLVYYLNGKAYSSAPSVPLNQWSFVGYTISMPTNPPAPTNTLWVVGYQITIPSRAFNGLISNVQVYNASLSANEVTALYDEGIGGVPININNLVGWWPLNGNANDYSGDLNNGVQTSIVFTNSWTSGYSAP